jgi:hypothetical protein
MPISMVKML